VFKKTVGKAFDEGLRPMPNGILIGDSAYPSTDYLVKMVSTPPDHLKKFYRLNGLK
jgi:hypothetical protein